VTAPLESQPDVIAFVDAARAYRAYVEGAAALPLLDRLVQARERLLVLYHAGSRLPDVESPDGVEATRGDDRPPSWPGLGDHEEYWEVFDPYQEDSLVSTTLSDDILDVYRDVGQGLRLWDRDLPREAAIWEWRFHFEWHWGDHAIDALRALHRACLREARANDHQSE
jgi:hypothetical protein